MVSVEKNRSESGFSLMELIVAMTVMTVILGAAFQLMGSGFKVATTTYELTDAGDNLRTAQEFLNRDLTEAGDGLKGIGTIQVPTGFVTNYLTQSPVNPSGGYVNLEILTSDDNIAGTTVVLQANPAANVQALSDRLTMLTTDQDFTPVTVLAGKISNTATKTSIVVNNSDLTSTPLSALAAGEILAISSSNSMAFAYLSSITLTTPDSTHATLVFNNGDPFGLNFSGAGTPIYTVSSNGTLATSIGRVKIIHYYVNSNNLLVRRVFGVHGASFVDSVIGDHIVGAQYRYVTNVLDANGFVTQPVRALSTSSLQISVRQVETTITAETVHQTLVGGRQQLSMTGSTSVRNMQFRQALSPPGT